jgi:hypothetical protein
MSTNTPIGPLKIDDPIQKSNYKLLWRYLNFLLEEGIQFLRNEYISQNDQTTLTRFSAISFYDFVLKDTIQTKIKNIIRVILNAGIECVPFYNSERDEVDPDQLDKIIDRKYPLYAKNDMTLINSLHTHPAYPELEMISILTFRVAVIQAARILASKTFTHTYTELVKAVFNDKQSCFNSVNAILMMIDQMIDLFEQNLDLINIPVYQPAFTIRDFHYIRRIYEFAQTLLREEINKIYSTQYQEVK